MGGLTYPDAVSGDFLAPGDAGTIILGEALGVMRGLPDGCAGLVYADPPFNSGRTRRGTVRKGAADAGFADRFDDYVGWLRPRLAETRRLLARHGTFYLHVDPRESHYCKVLLDEVFGRDCFLNEVIWAYDYGGRARDRWPQKHDVLLVYVRTPGAHHFDQGAVERIPYMAPSLQSEERAARGKLPTDVWWQTIVPTTSKERTGYPTQKPLAILRRIVSASSRPDDLVVDWCAGSGTTGVAARELGRRFLLIDESAEAVAVMRHRLANVAGLRVVGGAEEAAG
jgi:site-specific DNA-methyltransferase (adenine-specific)